MHGADIAQLRSLAQRFDQAAVQLDQARAVTSNQIQIQAWKGPDAGQFRHEWQSNHTRTLFDAAQRLRLGADTLRRNADEQDHTSRTDTGSLPGGGAPGSGGIMPMPGIFGGLNATPAPPPSLFDKLLKQTKTAVTVGKGVVKVAEWAEKARLIRNTPELANLHKSIQTAAFNSTKVGKFLNGAGKVLGIAGVGLTLIEGGQRLAGGDADGAFWSLGKAGLGAAALIPGPQQPFVIAASIIVTGADWIRTNPEKVAKFVSGVKDVSKTVVKTVANVASGFKNNVKSGIHWLLGRK